MPENDEAKLTRVLILKVTVYAGFFLIGALAALTGFHTQIGYTGIDATDIFCRILGFAMMTMSGEMIYNMYLTVKERSKIQCYSESV